MYSGLSLFSFAHYTLFIFYEGRREYDNQLRKARILSSLNPGTNMVLEKKCLDYHEMVNPVITRISFQEFRSFNE